MQKNSLFIILLLILFPSIATAQQSTGNSTVDSNGLYDKIVQKNIEWLNETYIGKIDPSFELINGIEYFPYYYLSNYKPILFFGRRHSGSVTINVLRYESISLDYDTFADKIIYVDSIWSYISNGIIEYNHKPVCYVDLGNGFTRIKSDKQFIRMFGKMSGEVKRFSKKSGIKIRRNDKQQIMSVLRFYDNLSNSIN